MLLWYFFKGPNTSQQIIILKSLFLQPNIVEQLLKKNKGIRKIKLCPTSLHLLSEKMCWIHYTLGLLDMLVRLHYEYTRSVNPCTGLDHTTFKPM